MRLAFASLLACALAGPVAAGPRIVSTNPCVDAILREVAAPGQVAGISRYSHDPAATSVPLEWANHIPATGGSAEEVMALAPQLVITGGHVSPATLATLRRLGVAVLPIGVPDSVAQSRAQILRIAAAAGQPARGRALVARIDRAIAAARPAMAARPQALVWAGGGLVPGRGTLVDELLQLSGFANQSATLGLERWDRLALEPLIARPPQVLLAAGPQAADRLLGHPALAGLATRIPVRRFESKLLFCGGPTIIPAIERLAAIRASL